MLAKYIQPWYTFNLILNITKNLLFHNIVFSRKGNPLKIKTNAMKSPVWIPCSVALKALWYQGRIQEFTRGGAQTCHGSWGAQIIVLWRQMITCALVLISNIYILVKSLKFVQNSAMTLTPCNYCIQIWSPYLAKDIDLLEKVQRHATKLLPSLCNLPYESRLWFVFPVL